MKHLEERFNAICNEYRTSFAPTTHMLALAMDIGVSAGHVHVASANQLTMAPPSLRHYGKHSAEHFEHACKKEARRISFEQAAAVRRSMLSGLYQTAAAGSPSTWIGPASPPTYLPGSQSVPLDLSTTIQLPQEGPAAGMHTASALRTSARDSWITAPTYNLQHPAKQGGTFPRRALRRISSNRSLSDEEVSFFNEHSGSSDETSRGLVGDGQKGRWWGSLRGWMARK